MSAAGKHGGGNMGRKVVFSDAEVLEARRMVSNATNIRQLKDGLSVVLSADLGLTNTQVAEALRSSPATVVRMHGRIRSRVTADATGSKSKSAWGGRRHTYMTPEEEKEFLRPWEEQAASGGVLVVPPIHAAFECRVHRRVQPATVYRLLARHGWRKIAPDNIHPKGNVEAQE